MQIKDILTEIEKFAPLALQESYDNAGVQCGDINQEARGVLLTLDVTEAVIDEAIEKGDNLIIAHHPLIFSGLKKITGKNTVEKCLIKAIKHDIVIYAAHTNLDNVMQGVNHKIANKLNLQNLSILSPIKQRLLKLYSYAPAAHVPNILNALYDAGAGAIGNYSECSFQQNGVGSFRAMENTKPFIGTTNGSREVVDEIKFEVLLPDYLQEKVTNSLKKTHPYEEVAFEIIRIENSNQSIGSGMIGQLTEPMGTKAFFEYLKMKMGLQTFKHTLIHKEKIQNIALCGGSGSFLLQNAIAAKADVFITADFKYHQFFDAENQIIITDIGHFESEQYTQEIFMEILDKKFRNFAIHLSKVDTNPVKYYI